MTQRTENRCYTCGNFNDVNGRCRNPCCPESPGLMGGGRERVV